jgi:hypothetical protein
MSEIINFPIINNSIHINRFAPFLYDKLKFIYNVKTTTKLTYKNSQPTYLHQILLIKIWKTRWCLWVSPNDPNHKVKCSKQYTNNVHAKQQKEKHTLP